MLCVAKRTPVAFWKKLVLFSVKTRLFNFGEQLGSVSCQYYFKLFDCHDSEFLYVYALMNSCEVLSGCYAISIYGSSSPYLLFFPCPSFVSSGKWIAKDVFSSFSSHFLGSLAD